MLSEILRFNYVFWVVQICTKTDIPLRWPTVLAMSLVEAMGPVTNLRTEGTNHATLRGRLHSRPRA